MPFDAGTPYSEIISGVLSDLAEPFKNFCKPKEADLEFLLKTCDFLKPKKILEMGSGWSTMVMAEWCDANGAHIESLESNAHIYGLMYWAIQKRFPLRKKSQSMTTEEFDEGEVCRVLFSPILNSGHRRGIYYGYQCCIEPDLVYLDGPELYGQRQIVDNTVSFCNEGFPSLIIVDGRLASAHFLWQLYKQVKRPYIGLHDLAGDRSLLINANRTDIVDWANQSSNYLPFEELPCARPDR